MNICDCAERDCHAHYGRACGNVATTTLYRTELPKQPRSFCEDCAAEARLTGEWAETGIETKLMYYRKGLSIYN